MNVIDYICIAVLLLFMIVAAVKGFAKIILHLLAYLAAGICARMAAAPVSDFLYSHVIHQAVNDKLMTLFPSGSIGGSVDQMINAIKDALPALAYNIASFLHLLPQENAFSDSLYTVQQLEESFVQPIITKVLIIITTIALFVVLMIILNMLVHFIDKKMFKDKKGAVSFTNRLLGMLFGLVQGAIPVAAVCLLLNLIAPILNQQSFADLVKNSLFCSFIAGIF